MLASGMSIRSFDSLCGYVSGLVSKELRSMDELNTAIEAWNDATDDYDNMIYLNEISVEA